MCLSLLLMCTRAGSDHYHGAHPRGEGDGSVGQQADQPGRLLPLRQQAGQPLHPLPRR